MRTRRTRFFLGALSPALLLLLAGCGATVVANTGCQSLATSASTINQGLVTIATSHGTYATTNDIAATVTNKTGKPIFTYNHKASCTILAIQQQVNGEWVTPDKLVAGCPLETPTGLVELAPGQPQTVSIHAGYLRSAPWPAGTYRLVLTYFTSRPDATQGQGAHPQVGTTTVYSQPLSLIDCGAPTAAGGSSATPRATAQPAATITILPQP